MKALEYAIDFITQAGRQGLWSEHNARKKYPFCPVLTEFDRQQGKHLYWPEGANLYYWKSIGMMFDRPAFLGYLEIGDTKPQSWIVMAAHLPIVIPTSTVALEATPGDPLPDLQDPIYVTLSAPNRPHDVWVCHYPGSLEQYHTEQQHLQSQNPPAKVHLSVEPGCHLTLSEAIDNAQGGDVIMIDSLDAEEQLEVQGQLVVKWENEDDRKRH